MRVIVEIGRSEVSSIEMLLARINRCPTLLTSHGPLDVDSLAQMLLADVAIAGRWPASRVGTSLLLLLAAHGYDASPSEEEEEADDDEQCPSPLAIRIPIKGDGS